MAARVLLTVLRIFAVCVLFAVCFVAGGALSGLSKVSPQASLDAQASQTPSQSPDNLLYPLLIISLPVGFVLSYLILRSSWHGWSLAGAIFVAMYGISTVVSQIETLFFLSNKLPHGMIPAIFLQGAITAALFAPLAVLLLGKWRIPSLTFKPSSLGRLHISSIAVELAVIVVVFVFLYMFFGYYVAWQSPAVREYYGGPAQASFLAALKANWMHNPWIYALQVFRALLYAACMYPLVRMLRVPRWETALAMALFLSVWTTVLLLPNPLMPSEVAHAHFRETLGFSIVFGGIAGWLLSKPPKSVESVTAS